MPTTYRGSIQSHRPGAALMMRPYFSVTCARPSKKALASAVARLAEMLAGELPHDAARGEKSWATLEISDQYGPRVVLRYAGDETAHNPPTGYRPCAVTGGLWSLSRKDAAVFAPVWIATGSAGGK